MQRVKVYIKISGDYCAFHEMNFRVVYDLTNDKQFGYYSKEALDDWEYEDYCDVKLVDAILVDGKYYVN